MMEGMAWLGKKAGKAVVKYVAKKQVEKHVDDGGDGKKKKKGNALSKGLKIAGATTKAASNALGNKKAAQQSAASAAQANAKVAKAADPVAAGNAPGLNDGQSGVLSQASQDYAAKKSAVTDKKKKSR